MKLSRCKTDTWGHLDAYKGRQKGIKYQIIETISGNYYVMAEDIKKDLTLNSLWIGKEFETVASALLWCETNPDIEEIIKKLKM